MIFNYIDYQAETEHVLYLKEPGHIFPFTFEIGLYKGTKYVEMYMFRRGPTSRKHTYIILTPLYPTFI